MHIDPKDLRIDWARPDSPGGQHVGSVHYGVRVTHLPTGTVAEVNARSQHLSRTIAMEMIEWALSNPRNFQ